MKKYLYFSMIVLFFLGCSVKEETMIKSVLQVDTQKYLGNWYEIARYENRFERGCVGASANYLLDKDKLKVTNRCFDAKGEMIGQANGSAYIVQNSNGSKLKVTFFWPFYGDYWIIKLADDYRYSVVSDPKQKYLWILAREKQLSQEDKKEILEFLEIEKYDTSKLFWTNLEHIK